jgi:GNAT superfamily N-acetyltransferase
MEVRYAEAGDIGAIVDVARRAQDALTATGSQQRLTLPSPNAVAAHIAARTAYVLAEGGTVLGSVFVEAVTVRRMPVLARCGLDDSAYPRRYLHTLVIEPTMQGRGLGHVLLNGVKAAVAAQGCAAIVLDCWAGNDTLRAFYACDGFHLHGIFAEADYEIAVFVWRSPPPRASSVSPPRH